MELKNVLDRLKEIAESNDSEQVATAIKQMDAYSFKDRLAEAEGASIYETPSDEDDQYCAVCGNTGKRLDSEDEPCPNCGDEANESTDDKAGKNPPEDTQVKKVTKEGSGGGATFGDDLAAAHPEISSEKEFISLLHDVVAAKLGDKSASGLINRDEDFIPDSMGDYKAAGGKLSDPNYMSEEGGDNEIADTWKRIADRVSTRDEGGAKTPDDTQVGQGDDPWGIGETRDGFDADGNHVSDDGNSDGEIDPDRDEDEQQFSADDLDSMGEDRGEQASAAGDYNYDDGDRGEQAAAVNMPSNSGASAGGDATDRVSQRAQRSGKGGPLDRIHQRHEEKYAALEEEMGRVFQTPMERHSWIMNQLSNIAGQMAPEDAAMVKKLMKTAGEADVKGGNC